MNRRRLWLAFLPALSAVLSVPVAHAMDFSACVHAALQRNPSALLAEAQAAQAKGAVDAAQGHLLPKLSASFSGAQSNNALTVFGMKLSQRVATFNDFGANQFDPSNPSALNIRPNNLDHPGGYHNLGTEISLAIPIWNGGAVRSGIDAAEGMLHAAQAGDEVARQKLTFVVLQAYDGLVAAKAGLGVAEKASRAADAYVKTTKQLLAQGVVVKSDLLSAQVHQEEAALQVQQAKNAVANARANLALLIGKPMGTPLNVDVAVQPPLPAGDAYALEQQALASNPGLRALREKVHAAQANVDVARAAYLPHINAMAKQEWNGTTLGNAVPSYTVGGQIQWDLLDFSRSGQMDSAQAGVQAALANLQQAEDKTRLQVQKSLLATHLAAQRVEMRQLAVRQSEEAQRLVRLRYQNGVETLTGLLRGQASLDQSRAELVEARYEEAIERGALFLAIGKMDLQSLTGAPNTGEKK
ncbi:TolC family protein [Acidithiobacillus sp.]|uniref:TolC family protein n=1 Tax=Acidithiobacillus sp. TaxID=1872118 RepID=UPI0032AE9E59